MIRMEAIGAAGLAPILGLRVGGDQRDFVAPNDQSLIEAWLALAHHGQAFPFGLWDGDAPVGFCMIGFGTDDEWTDAPAIAQGSYNIWRLMIDARYQGRGYGRAAMERILAWIRTWPCGPAERCWLSYEPENTAAKALYASFGFRETGEWDGDEVIAALELTPPDQQIRPVTEADRAFWLTLDRHLDAEAFSRKVRERTGYVLNADGAPAGLLRWSLFWDSIPFCNLLAIREDMRGQGHGRALVRCWEQAMRTAGFGLVMTSTQSDEAAQGFWRRLGYRDCGSFILPFPGWEQPAELMLAKPLEAET